MKPWKLQLAGWLLYAVARLLRATWRIEVVGAAHRAEAERLHAHRSFCLALWHEHLFANILGHAFQPFAPLASLSKDGELVTFVMDRLGFQTVRGSSSRRGPEARDELVEIVEKGFFTAITVDGPRGPRRRVKGGVIDVARRSGVAVLPVAAIADRQWVMHKSWDKFKIPKPFSRVRICYAAPVVVPPETHGLAFGEMKAAVRLGMAEAEREARLNLGLAALEEAPA